LKQIHSLLKRQLKRFFGTDSLPKECPDFIVAVNEAYSQFDTDRAALERSLDLSSEELLKANSQMYAVFERIIKSSVDGILAFDRECGCTVWNPGMERITGVSKEQALGKHTFDVFPPFKETMEHRFFSETLAGKTVIAKEMLYIIPETDLRGFFEGHFSPLRNESGHIIGGLAIIRDITDRKQAEETIKRQAYYDTLTGLPNRTLFQDRLRQAILVGAREDKPTAVLLLDLNSFKEINNTLGHHRGDALLQMMGPRLQEVLRVSDTIARFGGDEFGVLLPNTDTEGASQVARKILKALEPPFMIEGLPINVETSIGIALHPDHGGNPDSLIQRADVAMYTAKRIDGGYAIYKPKQDQHSPRRLALMGELRHAIEREQLFLHYQPKISLKTGKIMGVEALVRWRHPQLGIIPPDQFIVPAEQTGIIKPLTAWILNTALWQCKSWHQGGLEIPIAVNLSARTLHDPQLADEVAKLLQTYGMAPQVLQLEITETAIMVDPGHVLGIVDRLSQMGIPFSIDDFGTGYSSMAYLKRLPVDEIKIDRSFVKDMIGNDNDAVIVRSTIDLGHNLDLKVVAEGVENRETWDRLAALGCDAAQGYYMSRPIPAEELTRWLSESPWGLKGSQGNIE